MRDAAARGITASVCKIGDNMKTLSENKKIFYALNKLLITEQSKYSINFYTFLKFMITDRGVHCDYCVHGSEKHS